MVALAHLSAEQITVLLNTNARSRTPRRSWLSRGDGWKDTQTPKGSVSGSFVGKAGTTRKYIADSPNEVIAYKV